MIDPDNDTSQEAAAVQLELVRKMPGSERLAGTIDLTSQMVRMSKNAKKVPGNARSRGRLSI